MRHLIPSLALATALGAAAAAGSAPALPRDETLAVLTAITPAAPGPAGFEASVEDGNGGAFRIGDDVSFELTTGEPTHATLFYVDAYGAAMLYFIGGTGPDGALAGESTTVVPTEKEGFKLEVVPPVGLEDLVFVATREPIRPEELGFDAGTRITSPIDPEAAPAVARRLADLVAARDGATVKRVAHRVVAGTDDVEYTTREIVAHFKSTRALRRPRLPMHLNFGVDSADVTDSVRRNLDEMGQAMQHPTLEGRIVIIGGHTDDQGDEAYNLDLSRRRAEAVARYLLEQHGIDEDRFTVRAFGESQPIESGTTAEARAANRRVEFELSK